ncbi:MAG: HigA family addiction module antitoxin [Proteobacteria bacterium]|nr:HigA family addiction module antitoxin [Pseudomonadota bacterium]
MAINNPKPMHPGRVLAEIYMQELGLNQTRLAEKLGCAHRKINEIINGKRGITPDFALDLEVVIGTKPDMWVAMQAAWDLYQAKQKRRVA